MVRFVGLIHNKVLKDAVVMPTDIAMVFPIAMKVKININIEIKINMEININININILFIVTTATLAKTVKTVSKRTQAVPVSPQAIALSSHCPTSISVRDVVLDAMVDSERWTIHDASEPTSTLLIFEKNPE